MRNTALLQRAVGVSPASSLLLVLALVAGLVAVAVPVQGGTPTIPFTQPFNSTTNLLVLTPATRWGLFRQSDAITVTAGTNTSITVYARDGSTVYQGVPTTLHLACGHYFVETRGDRAQFAVLPDTYVGASFLGTEGDNSWQPLSQKIQQIQPAWQRTFDGEWSTVQPSNNVWNWSYLDKVVSNAVNQKVIAVAADQAPTWVSVQTNQFNASYLQFLAALATRYKGKLAAVEIWNEPGWSKLPASNWVGQVEWLYVQGRATVKAIDPAMKVVGPAWYTPVVTPEAGQLAQLGIGSILEALTWHDYTTDGAPPDKDTLWLGTTPVVLNVMQRLGAWRDLVGDSTRSVYVDELGLGAQSPLGLQYPQRAGEPPLQDWYRGMLRGVKLALLYRAAGADCIIPHTIDLAVMTPTYNDASWFGWEYGGRGPHPKTSAFLMACYWLNSATLVDYRTLGNQVFLYAWSNPSGSAFVFAWCLEGLTAPLKANSLTAVDLYRKSIQPTALTEEPVLFQSSTLTAEMLLNNVVGTLATNINVAPVIADVPTQNIQVGQQGQFTVSAVDPDHEPVTYSASGLLTGATFTPATATFAWTPTTTQAGSHQVVITATDLRGLTATTSVTINVLNGANDGLSALWKFDESSGTTAADSAGTNPGTLKNFSFTAASGWVSGHIGNALRFDGTNDAVSLTSSKISLTNNFAVSLWFNPNNAATAAYQALLAVRSAYHLSGFRMFVTGNALQIEGQTTVGWKSPGFAQGAVKSGVWQHLVVSYDQSTMTVYLNGQVQGTSDWGGNLVMDPAQYSWIGVEGSSYFGGMIDDLRIYQRPLAAVEVQVLYQGINEPPSFTPISAQSVTAGRPLSFTVSATDPNGSTVTYSASGLPSGASFNTTSHAFSWTPALSQTGTFNVAFIASDGTLTATQTVAIAVAADRPPVFTTTGAKSTVAGVGLNFTVSASDPDGSAVTYSAGSLPSGASFTASTHTFNWTPALSQTGTVSVAFMASDGSLTATQTVAITVAAAPQPPVFASLAAQSVTAGQTVSFTILATDPLDQPLSYSASGLPTGASFNAVTRVFSWTPTATQVGVFTVSFTASNGTLASVQSVVVTVGAAP